MNVYVVIPYFSDGIEIKSNDIKVFNTREAAYQYAVKERFTHYDIIASEYIASPTVSQHKRFTDEWGNSDWRDTGEMGG